MKLRLCFLWHMHQPYYKDPETGTYTLPWVRLHAVKDYVSLPRIFREFRGVRHTFNLVPSLLIQVRDYVENGAEDIFLAVSRKNALDLSRDEEEFILRNFFSAFAPTMILPQPRYAELFRGHENAIRSLRGNGRSGTFGASEYTDLVTLFNLAWYHPLHLEEDPELSRLWRKGGRYTEREKQYVLDRQIDVMGAMFDEYRKLEKEDGGELSSSPMYHPILPLLIDNRSAQDAWPGASLPSMPFSFPRDARRQLERGRDVFRDLFGANPKGLWPSEGSISPATLDLASEAGFRWIATDEALLSKALGKPIHRNSDGIPMEPRWLYRPYSVKTPSGDIRILFRDHRLSDLIGFEYSRWNADDAANNFVHNIKCIYDSLSSNNSTYYGDDPIVPVILDGENAWEYFPDSGVYFLRTLMSKLEQLRPVVECVPVSEALEQTRTFEELPSVPTGSWIDGTFHIWIGHPEDHAAWDMLSRVRSLWESKAGNFEKSGEAVPEKLKEAEEYIFAAEGSDWCWWYGDDHFTPHGPEFDRLFRHNIKAAYNSMGINPPDMLDVPIIKAERIPSRKNAIPAPMSYIHPNIDGIVTSYFEWSSAFHYIPNPEFGTMHRAARLILSSFFYGFSKTELFFRFDIDPVATENTAEVTLELLFPEKNRKMRIDLNLPEGTSSCTFSGFGGSHHADPGPSVLEAEHEFGVRMAYSKVVEIGFPFELIDCVKDERLEFFITIQPKGTLGERWPMYGTFSAELPGSDFSERMWGA